MKMYDFYNNEVIKIICKLEIKRKNINNINKRTNYQEKTLYIYIYLYNYCAFE